MRPRLRFNQLEKKIDSSPHIHVNRNQAIQAELGIKETKTMLTSSQQGNTCMARLSNSQATVWAYAIMEQFNERIENKTKVSRKRTYEV